MAALERALLQVNANAQPGNNAAPRRVERKAPLGDNSRDPPNAENPALPSYEEYYQDDDRSYHSSQDLTYYPPSTPTNDRAYEIDGIATNSSQAEWAIRRSTRDQVA
ncbi:f-box/LRR-repeat protein 7-like isoform 2 [Corchorus olitorius]|uniref:F-box/LRR-repeat protein 7-like isoform 2 n=1 Tax=Corchorus olitorius TaxID=93759 RepID=A0A1R3KHZ2_9ROSI|nr:f-box/LRR-repeat protein 7-like isoform 2 [Corchorus olitorius]